MTEYERGRRDAIRDAIVFLVEYAKTYEHYFNHEPEYYTLNSAATELEQYTAVAPVGRGVEWDV